MLMRASKFRCHSPASRLKFRCQPTFSKLAKTLIESRIFAT